MTPFRTLRARAPYRSSVALLAIHYVRLAFTSPGRHVVTVSFPVGSAGADAALVFELDSYSRGSVESHLLRIDPEQPNEAAR